MEKLSVRGTLAKRHIMLIGVTGFIGKVWLVNLLENIPEIGKITLLIRRNRTTSSQRRFEKIVEESPTFDTLQERYGRNLGAFLKEKVEVVEGDVSEPGLGLDAATQARLAKSLDLIVNSAGLTDFNPDLREALSSNVDSAVHLLEFIRQVRPRGIDAPVHLLRGGNARRPRDGRIKTKLQPYGRSANLMSSARLLRFAKRFARVEERAEGVEIHQRRWSAKRWAAA